MLPPRPARPRCPNRLHIALSACSAPEDVNLDMADLLLSLRHKSAIGTDRLQQLKRKLDRAAVVRDTFRTDRPDLGIGLGQTTAERYETIM